MEAILGGQDSKIVADLSLSPGEGVPKRDRRGAGAVAGAVAQRDQESLQHWNDDWFR